MFYGNDLELGLPGVFGVSKCLNCKHMFTSPRPTEAWLPRYYPAQYGPYNIEVGAGHNESLNRTYDAIFANPLVRLLKVMRKGRILDYGTGSGSLLYELKQSGWDAFGLDMSEVAVERARSLGLKVTLGRIQDAGYPDDFFDVCTMFHVLEHLARPKETVRDISRVIRPGGLLLISIPNAASIEAHMFGRFWFGWGLPRHLQHFTPTSVSTMLADSSFDVKKIIHDSSHIWLQTTLLWALGKKHGMILRRPFSMSIIAPSFLIMVARQSPVIHIIAEKRP